MSEDKIEKLETPNQPDTKTTAKTSKKRKVKGSNRIAKWFREMRSELKKVVWPTPKQTVNNTIIALVVMACSAVLVWALDYVAGQIFVAITTYIPMLIQGG
ncbi:MAG: preprotein translocase subunit SecE [Oscillospiraceae bacterium]|nr:preprotein translocase subunit SecE [Oscillospiraceae bacterium]